jgi:hypothetical protein
MNFCPLANTAPKARLGWKAARLYVSKEAKPAKIISLIVRQLAGCVRPLKEKEIFFVILNFKNEPANHFPYRLTRRNRQDIGLSERSS